ncbi:hypothetical protein L9F63_023670 [Diploptera punctata]|uniref:Uncharacterized protein n=1 Tax=Diploptera punctata TaxID=6984 RepID=A0AAD7ZI66_DIPPU|nr:hypothetical protein L9F63_023670 [Diploptera punctata]
MRMEEEENTTRKLTLLRPDGGRRRGRPKPPKARVPGMQKEGVGQGCVEGVLTAAKAHKGL